MNRRGFALHLILTIGAVVIVLLVWVGTLPRVRPDMVQIALHHDGRPMRSVLVMLSSSSPENLHCQADGLRGLTDWKGHFVWERSLPEQNLLGFGPQVDEIVVCALISGQQILLWKRKHLAAKERMNLSCDTAAIPNFNCVAEYDVTLGQTFYLTVMSLLAALLVRVFWYRKTEAVSGVAVVLFLIGVFGSSLIFSIAATQFTQWMLTALAFGGLLGLHAGLSEFVRKSEDAAGTPETGNSGSSIP